jgi:hypothetical protein
VPLAQIGGYQRLAAGLRAETLFALVALGGSATAATFVTLSMKLRVASGETRCWP